MENSRLTKVQIHTNYIGVEGSLLTLHHIKANKLFHILVPVTPLFPLSVGCNRYKNDVKYQEAQI